MENKDSIKNLIEQQVEAIRSQDIDKAVSNYSNDCLIFDVIGDLSNRGSELVKIRLTEWFSTMKELVNFEVNIINIEASDSVAFCNSFNHIQAIKKDGEKLDMWWRETLGLKKISNEWTVTSAHSSVPFDVQNGKASMNLKP